MSELRLETLSMPTAEVGPVNPLPPLFSAGDLHSVLPAATEEIIKRKG